MFPVHSVSGDHRLLREPNLIGGGGVSGNLFVGLVTGDGFNLLIGASGFREPPGSGLAKPSSPSSEYRRKITRRSRSPANVFSAVIRRAPGAVGFCWAHVRRRFYELAAAGASPVATDVLARIAKLYAVEADVRGQSPEQRRAKRQDNSRPIIEELRRVLDARLAQVSRKSRLAEAIRYALTRWEGLTRFLDDGRIELDSNAVERSIRPLALNRKNALFAGSDDGGDHWAVIASMIETCKLNGIDPQTWLTDTLTKLTEGHGRRRLDELMPWNYPLPP